MRRRYNAEGVIIPARLCQSSLTMLSPTLIYYIHLSLTFLRPSCAALFVFFPFISFVCLPLLSRIYRPSPRFASALTHSRTRSFDFSLIRLVCPEVISGTWRRSFFSATRPKIATAVRERVLEEWWRQAKLKKRWGVSRFGHRPRKLATENKNGGERKVRRQRRTAREWARANEKKK